MGNNWAHVTRMTTDFPGGGIENMLNSAKPYIFKMNFCEYLTVGPIWDDWLMNNRSNNRLLIKYYSSMVDTRIIDYWSNTRLIDDRIIDYWSTRIIRLLFVHGSWLQAHGWRPKTSPSHAPWAMAHGALFTMESHLVNWLINMNSFIRLRLRSCLWWFSFSNEITLGGGAACQNLQFLWTYWFVNRYLFFIKLSETQHKMPRPRVA